MAAQRPSGNHVRLPAFPRIRLPGGSCINDESLSWRLSFPPKDHEVGVYIPELYASGSVDRFFTLEPISIDSAVPPVKIVALLVGRFDAQDGNGGQEDSPLPSEHEYQPGYVRVF